jgi:hypothetical protein
MLLKNLSPTCDKCGRSSQHIAEFSQVYRLMEIRAGRPNPGNLCGECAGAQTAERIVREGGTQVQDLRKELFTVH